MGQLSAIFSAINQPQGSIKSIPKELSSSEASIPNDVSEEPNPSFEENVQWTSGRASSFGRFIPGRPTIWGFFYFSRWPINWRQGSKQRRDKISTQGGMWAIRFLYYAFFQGVIDVVAHASWRPWSGGVHPSNWEFYLFNFLVEILPTLGDWCGSILFKEEKSRRPWMVPPLMCLVVRILILYIFRGFCNFIKFKGILVIKPSCQFGLMGPSLLI